MGSESNGYRSCAAKCLCQPPSTKKLVDVRREDMYSRKERTLEASLVHQGAHSIENLQFQPFQIWKTSYIYIFHLEELSTKAQFGGQVKKRGEFLTVLLIFSPICRQRKLRLVISPSPILSSSLPGFHNSSQCTRTS